MCALFLDHPLAMPSFQNFVPSTDPGLYTEGNSKLFYHQLWKQYNDLIFCYPLSSDKSSCLTTNIKGQLQVAKYCTAPQKKMCFTMKTKGDTIIKECPLMTQVWYLAIFGFLGEF